MYTLNLRGKDTRKRTLPEVFASDQMVAQKIAGKNIAGQVLTYKSQKIQCVNKKRNWEQDMNELGKPFIKTFYQKIFKKIQLKIESEMQHVNKKNTGQKS